MSLFVAGRKAKRHKISFIGVQQKAFGIQIHLPDEGHRYFKRVFEQKIPDLNEVLSLLHMYEVEFVDAPELEGGDWVLHEAVGARLPKAGEFSAARMRYFHLRKYPDFLPPERAAELLRILRQLSAFTEETLAKRKELKALKPRLGEERTVLFFRPTWKPRGIKPMAKLFGRPFAKPQVISAIDQRNCMSRRISPSAPSRQQQSTAPSDLCGILSGKLSEMPSSKRRKYPLIWVDAKSLQQTASLKPMPKSNHSRVSGNRVFP